MWAFGDILGHPRDLDEISVALVVDLPVDQVAWMTRPPPAEHWLRMTRLVKNPVQVWWRPALAPVWNHRISSPLLIWDDLRGLREEALSALREGRGKSAAEPGPTPEALVARLADELDVSRSALRTCTAAYGNRQWGPSKLGPTADALWLASSGYLDLLDAQRSE